MNAIVTLSKEGENRALRLRRQNPALLSLQVDKTEARIDVDRVILHEKYNPRTADNDIALMRLSQPVKLSKHIAPACLASKALPQDTFCYSVGWGATHGTGYAGILKQVYVPLISHEKCNSEAYYDGDITKSMMCAGYEQGEHDTCQVNMLCPLITFVC